MRIHYWELSNYNNGNLIGKWFDLDGIFKDEHLAEVYEWLEQVSKETGELCEEWIVGDTEEIPDNLCGEYSLNEEFWGYAELIKFSRLDVEAIEAGAYLGIPFDKIEEAYCGEYESDTDMAYNFIEQAYPELDQAMGSLAGYFDYEAYAYDLMINDYQSHNGYYFSRHC